MAATAIVLALASALCYGLGLTLTQFGLRDVPPAAIPGDGIGKEVVPAGQRVLEALAAATTGLKFEFQNFEWGGDYFRP